MRLREDLSPSWGTDHMSGNGAETSLHSWENLGREEWGQGRLIGRHMGILGFFWAKGMSD